MSYKNGRCPATAKDNNNFVTIDVDITANADCISFTGRKNVLHTNTGLGKSRKRKHREVVSCFKLETKDDKVGEALELNNKLCKLSVDNAELHNDVEFECIKNEQIVAFIKYKSNELAHAQQQAEERALIITDDPTVPKLTRSKARKLNKMPIISFPALEEKQVQPEIIRLIKDELHSDEDDEEYIIQDDLVSDDATTISDMDSCPSTPQTKFVQTETNESPLKLSADGYFKIPLEKNMVPKHLEDLRIATRTRSKLCLEQTTIEAIQSTFVPPDVEDCFDFADNESAVNDEEWMRFLYDFSKPLNQNIVGDDDDLINDPEYIAAEKERIDAEELRNVNIPKKELKDLVEELLESLNNADISLDSIDLDPNKTLLFRQSDDNKFPSLHNAFRALPEQAVQSALTESQSHLISSTNTIQQDISFSPDVMSTPSTLQNLQANIVPDEVNSLIPIGLLNNCDGESSDATVVSLPTSAINTEVELIAVPIPDQPNCFELARVVKAKQVSNATTNTDYHRTSLEESEMYHSSRDKRYIIPYDNNYTTEYISVRRHLLSEYMKKFENLRYAQDEEVTSTTVEMESVEIKKQQRDSYGFTEQQYQLLQQQLRIHVQMLTQTFLQTHCHPTYWKMGNQSHNMMQELKLKSKTNNNFNTWNLDKALMVVDQWKEELNEDTKENREIMQFIHKEIDSTTSNARQIPKFHPRIMEKILNSDVFMYPQYLPRMPFTHRLRNFEAFAPAESQLIAMGLEKHFKQIVETHEKVYHKSNPLSLACKRLCGDTVWGKSHRRVWDQIKSLEKVDYYNPIKYFFEHNHKAPPIDPMPIIGFENGIVLAPKDRINELPLVWKSYLKENNALSNTSPVLKHNKSHPSATKAKSEKGSCPLEFGLEALGGDIRDYCVESKLTSSSNFTKKPNKKYSRRQTPKKRKARAHSLTINVNYVFQDLNRIKENVTSNSSDRTALLEDSTALNDNILPVSFLYEPHSQSLQPSIKVASASSSPNKLIDCQSKITDFFKPQKSTLKSNLKAYSHSNRHGKLIRKCASVLKKLRWVRHKRRLQRKTHKYGGKSYLQKRYQNFISAYQLYLKNFHVLYKHTPVVNHYYRYFKALELYTNLLKRLKMFCRQQVNASHGFASSMKRNRIKEEDDCGLYQRCSRKLNKQEENIKHMLLPDSAEEANRKDAFYAFNFYERVEETFKASNQSENCAKFNRILKNFDPTRDKVADLYCKLESLFLPDHPELAEIFLTFLMPSEAAEIGKFFEHFMINNMSTFISKLNIYFSKQPAQIRKIYNCLNELAEDPEVTMKKVENKILPLLKGNQFLIDWFMQQFPQSAPPERLFANPEHIINLKDCQNRSGYDHVETVNDLLDSPTGEQTSMSHQQQQQSCQLKYINGRIFYGSRVLLPAKLSFMASNYQQQQNSSQNHKSLQCSEAGCCHAIREYGDECLQFGLSNEQGNVTHNNSDNTEKFEGEETSSALTIDTAVGEDESNPTAECCDDNTLRAHAIRLNPSYYGSTCLNANLSSCPSSAVASHHNVTVKKFVLGQHHEEGKISPRKNSNPQYGQLLNLLLPVNQTSSCTTTATAGQSGTNTLNAAKEKRKSPGKKIKSPLQNSGRSARTSAGVQPMVIIHETNTSSAVACAKRLKTLIDEEEQQAIDTKDRLNIIARTKSSLNDAIISVTEDTTQYPFLPKTENSDDLEFLPESSAIPPNPLSSLNLDTDSTEDDQSIGAVLISPLLITADKKRKVINTTPITIEDSDDDYKLDNIAFSFNTDNHTNVRTTAIPTSSSTIIRDAWTRDEDKIFLLEMKSGFQSAQDLHERIAAKLCHRSLHQIRERHQFLVDFLAKFQEK